MYLNDQVGSKLGYYLNSTVTTSSAICTPEGQQVYRVELSLTRTLDPGEVRGLRPSISGEIYGKLKLAKGLQRYVILAYLPKDSTLLPASINGEPVEATGQTDEEHPVQVFWTLIPRGKRAR